METFTRARVMVVGIGGVGSWATEALARSGVGNLVLVDMDHVSESNINRQLVALDSTLGRAKIEVMRERIVDINPQARVDLVDDFLGSENLESLITNELDLVLDCIDSAYLKALLAVRCKQLDLHLVMSGGAGGRIDPTRIRHGDLSRTIQDSLLSRTRQALRKKHGFSRDPKKKFGIPAVWSEEQPAKAFGACDPGDGTLNCAGFGSSMPVTATFGLVAASLGLGLLAGV